MKIFMLVSLLFFSQARAAVNLTQIVGIQPSISYSNVSYVYLQLPQSLVGSCLSNSGQGIVKTFLIAIGSGSFEVEILADGTVVGSKDGEKYDIERYLQDGNIHFEHSYDCDLPILTGQQLTELQEKIAYDFVIKKIESEDLKDVPTTPFDVRTSDVLKNRRFGQFNSGNFTFWSGNSEYDYNHSGFNNHPSPVDIPEKGEDKYNFDEYTIYHRVSAQCEVQGKFANAKEATKAFLSGCGNEQQFLNKVDAAYLGTGKTVIQLVNY